MKLAIRLAALRGRRVLSGSAGNSGRFSARPGPANQSAGPGGATLRAPPTGSAARTASGIPNRWPAARSSFWWTRMPPPKVPLSITTGWPLRSPPRPAATIPALLCPSLPAPGGRGGRGGAAPATSAPLTFADDVQSIQFGSAGSMYKCSLSDYTCSKGGPVAQPAGRGGRGGLPTDEDDDVFASPSMVDSESIDGIEYLTPSPQQGRGGAASERGQPHCAGQPRNEGRGGRGGANAPEAPAGLHFIRRQMGSAHRKLQRLPAAGRRHAGRYPAELRRLGRQLLHLPVHRLVARFQEAGGVSHARPATTARCTTSSRRPPIRFSRSTLPSLYRSPATRWTSPIPLSSTCH